MLIYLILMLRYELIDNCEDKYLDIVSISRCSLHTNLTNTREDSKRGEITVFVGDDWILLLY